MSDYQALEKHACPACGAQATWNPGKQALICQFCGTEAPGELDRDSGKIREIDLVKTLREMPEELRGWQAERRTVRCRSCNAISVFEPERVAQNCPFCGSAALIDYEEIKSPIRPQSILPFRHDEAAIRERLRSWYESKWLAPGRLKKKASLNLVKGVYLPYWSFDSQVACPWTADSGTYYYVTESYRDANGNARTRQVRRTRWTPSSGHVEHFFDDEPIPATKTVDPTLLREIQPFPHNDLVPYDTAFLSGFVVEHYQIVLIDAAQSARESMNHKMMQLCAQQIPGDTYRNLRIDPRYSEQTFKHILVPVWIMSYIYNKKSYQILANGHTGEMAGRYPKSLWKILSIVFGLILFFLIVLILAR